MWRLLLYCYSYLYPSYLVIWCIKVLVRWRCQHLERVKEVISGTHILAAERVLILSVLALFTRRMSNQSACIQFQKLKF